ncbi:major facilitator superfamily domain-containing protein [Multifurca ochricompacta]|uniref:Major facilitator superfamily domain-containing protein n=1 Tax=Multifurca ochricompacta TaxID=376703 RepID=A0AAD4M8Q2_9AGAM|nr:major facilitator superfamily domain-containing protein [Multifurca ochricompacta]
MSNPSTQNDGDSDSEEFNDVAAHELNDCRVEALEAIDKAPFSWFHVKVCMVAGTGFFTDAYDIFAINIASDMLGILGSCSPTLKQPKLWNKGSSAHWKPVWTMFFGWLADIVGRKRMYGMELLIIVIATFVQALAGSGPAVHYGVGVGGDYPLSAVITSEFASTRTRGRLMTAVFASQGWGNLAASLVALIVTVAYKNSIIAGNFNEPKHVDYCWRILIGLGCVPGVIALYFRLTIPETPRFTMDIDRDVRKATTDIRNMLGPKGSSPGVYWVDPNAVVQRAFAPRRSRRDFIAYLKKRHNLQLLFGLAYSWFAIDVAFYGLGLNASNILTSDLLTHAGIGDTIDQSQLNTTLGIYKSLHNVVIGSLVVTVAGLLPGYYASFCLIDVWGRKPIQLMGFSVLTALLAILAGIYPGPRPTDGHQGKAKAFVALYCLANFFTNFGPNVTTFIIPGEVFPTRYRSTAHGIAAASGKLGAIVSQIIFFKVFLLLCFVITVGKCSLGIFAGVTLTGIGSTLLLEETRDKSLEQLSREQQEGFIQDAAWHSPSARLSLVLDGISWRLSGSWVSVY